MHLIEAGHVPTPADAERLMADLWQLTSGRALGLYLLGLHGGSRVMLGVHCNHPTVEALVASAVSDHCHGAVESGWAVSQMIELADEFGSVNMVPTDRHLAVDSSTFGWQRSDPLQGAYRALSKIDTRMVAGIGLTLRALPNLDFLMSMSSFAAGPGARLAAMRIASTYAGVGVHLRRPLLQRRAIQRTLSAAVRRPSSVKRVEIVTLFWHPPYGQESPATPTVAGSAAAGAPIPALPAAGATPTPSATS